MPADRSRLFRFAVFLLVAFFSVPSLAAGQVQSRFSGYVLDFPVYQQSVKAIPGIIDSSDGMFLNLMRLRLRPSVIPWDGASVSIEYEIDAQYQTRPVPGIGLSHNVSTQAFSMNWAPISGEHMSVDHVVDRLFFRQNFRNASMVIGRQRISWGTGRIWNPTDLFNPINPADFEKVEKDGADAASFKYYLGDFTDVEGVINPVDRFRRTNGAARYLTSLAGYDVSVMAASMNRRTIAGGDFAGNLFQAGIRGEGIVSVPQDNGETTFVRWILGVDYQCTPLLYVLAEFLYNGQGKSDAAQYDPAQFLSAETFTPGRSYIFLSALYRVHPLVSATLSLDANLNDGSGFVGPGISYSLAENATLELGALVPYSRGDAEFSYYPLSCYFRTQLYF